MSGLMKAAVPVPSPREPNAHDRLCEIACRWMKQSQSKGGHGCKVALPEGWAGQSSERADAIGWRFTGYSDGSDGSVLCEAKVSRSDFLADAAKPHRQDWALGVGRWRYFICPKGLIQAEELPRRWGLLWVDDRGRVEVVAGAALGFLLPRQGKDWPVWAGEKAAWIARYTFEERAQEVETAMLAKVVQRLGAPEEFLRRLRTQQNLANSLWSEVQQLRATVARLHLENAQLRLGVEDGYRELTAEMVR